MGHGPDLIIRKNSARVNTLAYSSNTVAPIKKSFVTLSLVFIKIEMFSVANVIKLFTIVIYSFL